VRRLALIACFMQFVSGARSSAGVGEFASCCLEHERQACLLFALLFSRVITALLVPQAGKQVSVRHPPVPGSLCWLQLPLVCSHQTDTETAQCSTATY
jgi:hypothetical protein